MLTNPRSAFPYLALVGLVLRLGFVLAATPSELTFQSGGSDAPSYALLAANLRSHAGFTYAGQPSAFRPPGYPLLVAEFMSVFGGRYISAIRWLQFALGILTVTVSALVALRLLDRRAAMAAFLLGLFLPTLVFTTAQVLTECTAAFLTALYFHSVVMQYEKSDFSSACGLGAFAGLGALVRFNAAALPIFSGCAVLWNRQRPYLLRMAVVLVLPLLIVLPWLVRNELVFRGQVLYSTHTGANAVQGVLSSQGRTQPGETQKLVNSMGWAIQQLETNAPSRLSLGSEAVLNRRALQVVPRLWKAEGWHAVPLLAKKVADFWLSRDQLIDVGSLNLRERTLRLGGVVAQWVILALAVLGWLRLRELRPALAYFFLLYAVGYTALHLPFVMNTRLRIPLMEPLLLILSGAGWIQVWDRWAGERNRRVPDTATPPPQSVSMPCTAV